MLTNFAREKARDILNAIAHVLARLGFSPNTLTVLGLVLVMIISAVIAAGYYVPGAVLAIFGLGFDATDGALARLTGRTSRFGAFLDSSLDRYADGILMFALVVRGLAVSNNLMVTLAVAALIGAFLVSYTRARAEGIGLEMKEGWFTRLERTIVLILGLLSTILFGDTGIIIALVILAVFSNLTAVQRIFAVRAKLGE